MMFTTLVVAVAGGIGAALRLALNVTVHGKVPTRYPVALTIINVSGSFVLGLISGLAGSHLLTPEWGVVLGVGLVGGYTAFSTTSFQTLRLVQERRWWAAVSNSFGMIVVAVIVAGLGLWLGRSL
ncbi:MAG TPA: CrcB family protein [Terrimesophilobacter sp.]|nr:CrcB family protein [Terrimesophilobacter sp.]